MMCLYVQYFNGRNFRTEAVNWVYAVNISSNQISTDTSLISLVYVNKFTDYEDRNVKTEALEEISFDAAGDVNQNVSALGNIPFSDSSKTLEASHNRKII